MNTVVTSPPMPPMTTPAALPSSAQPMSPSNPIRKKMTASRMCPPVMLPKSRNDSDSGRARWLMISITNIRGFSHQGTGPVKCLRYFSAPCFRTPIQWYETNTISAQAAVVFRLPVGPTSPGTRLMRFPVRMNRPRVAMSGRYRRPL